MSLPYTLLGPKITGDCGEVTLYTYEFRLLDEHGKPLSRPDIEYPQSVVASLDAETRLRIFSHFCEFRDVLNEDDGNACALLLRNVSEIGGKTQASLVWEFEEEEKKKKPNYTFIGPEIQRLPDNSLTYTYHLVFFDKNGRPEPLSTDPSGRRTYYSPDRRLILYITNIEKYDVLVKEYTTTAEDIGFLKSHPETLPKNTIENMLLSKMKTIGDETMFSVMHRQGCRKRFPVTLDDDPFRVTQDMSTKRLALERIM